MRLLNILLGHTVVFGVALAISSSCTVDYPATAFRCSPFDSNSCPEVGGKTYMCCSDDPAALNLNDLDAVVLPGYQQRGGTGTPIFSGGNNPLSKSGMCVDIGTVPPAFALIDQNAAGCPVPCNPTWDPTDVATVCGAGTFCCQTTELQPEDCVLDPNAGDNGCFRPVTGNDIEGVGTSALTNWAGSEHATHQDPSGSNCEIFVQGLGLGTDAAKEAQRACWRRLTVANQRGFCLGGPNVFGCPLANPAYRDACEQMNDANFLTGCG